jgi:hypothetical protein
MKATGLLLALLLTGAADELATTQVGALKLKAPAAWKRTADEGGTTRFAAPSGEAFFEVDVGQVQREGGMPAEECLSKILAGVGPDGFERLTIGGKPAAVKAVVDKDESGKEFHTYSYVGCDGMTTWSLEFHFVAAKKDRFEPLARTVGKSVEYAKGR